MLGDSPTQFEIAWNDGHDLSKSEQLNYTGQSKQTTENQPSSFKFSDIIHSTLNFVSITVNTVNNLQGMRELVSTQRGRMSALHRAKQELKVLRQLQNLPKVTSNDSTHPHFLFTKQQHQSLMWTSWGEEGFKNNQ